MSVCLDNKNAAIRGLAKTLLNVVNPFRLYYSEEIQNIISQEFNSVLIILPTTGSHGNNLIVGYWEILCSIYPNPRLELWESLEELILLLERQYYN